MPGPGTAGSVGSYPGDPNLPPGFTGNVSGLMGGYSAHPGVAQRFPGRTLAEKVNIFQKKAARESQLQFEAKIRQQAAIEQRLREQRFGTPSPPVPQGIGTLSPSPISDPNTFLADAQQLSTSFGIPLQQAIISLATSRNVDPTSFSPIDTLAEERFLTDAQQLSTSSGIPIQQAIISLAASRGLDPNQFLNVAPVGIGSIAPTSTTPPPTGGFFPKNVILDALSAAGVLPPT